MDTPNNNTDQLLKMRRVVVETILYLVREKKLSYYSIWKYLHTESCWTFLKLNQIWKTERKRKAQEAKHNAADSETIVIGLKPQENIFRVKKRRKGRNIRPYSKDYKAYRVVNEIDVDFWKRTIILLDDIIQGGIDGTISTR